MRGGFGKGLVRVGFVYCSRVFIEYSIVWYRYYFCFVVYITFINRD